jgi:hypothetical protein
MTRGRRQGRTIRVLLVDKLDHPNSALAPYHRNRDLVHPQDLRLVLIGRRQELFSGGEPPMAELKTECLFLPWWLWWLLVLTAIAFLIWFVLCLFFGIC